MKAIVQDRYGPADVLHLDEVTTPGIEEHDVLVRVRAASLNSYDKWMMLGRPFIARGMFGGFRRPKRRVRGTDLAGTVEAVGTKVTRFKAGDSVFGMGAGAFAEYASAEEQELALKPATLSFDEAAALPMAAATALLGFRAIGRDLTGRRVLIYGAGGGVGTFAIQAAKILGARVTAVTSPQHLDLVRSLGADEVLDYTREDFDRRPERYDVFFDISGTRPIRVCHRALTPDGIFVFVGGGNGKRHTPPIGRLMKASFLRRVFGYRIQMFLAKPTEKDFDELKDLAGAGRIRPIIDRRFPLDRAVDAMRYLETGQVAGKLVLTVP